MVYYLEILIGYAQLSAKQETNEKKKKCNNANGVSPSAESIIWKKKSAEFVMNNNQLSYIISWVRDIRSIDSIRWVFFYSVLHKVGIRSVLLQAINTLSFDSVQRARFGSLSVLFR